MHASRLRQNAGLVLVAMLTITGIVGPGVTLTPTTYAADVSFTQTILPAQKDGTYAIAAGDLNGDGTLDIVCGNYQTSGLLFNDGQGHFAPGDTLPGIGTVGDVALGDVNGDGALDIVLGKTDGLSEVRINDGRGHFPTAIALPESDYPSGVSVSTGDLNGDGAIDIILSSIYVGLDDFPNQLYLNDGQGGFSVSTSIGSLGNVTLGDVNGDKTIDLVFASTGDILLNDGSGHFAPYTRVPDMLNSVTARIGDMDGDGDLDIVTSMSVGAITVFVNDGQAHFVPAAYSYDTNIDIDLGDFDGNGTLDIIASTLRDIRMLHNDGRMHFTAIAIPNNSTNSIGLTTSDFNGDGLLDIVIGSSNGLSELLLNNGPPDFVSSLHLYPPVTTPDMGPLFKTTVGDLDGDGSLDLIVSENDENYRGLFSEIWFNDGHGRFANASRLPGNRDTTDIAVGDLNGDGRLDLVFSSSLSVGERVPSQILFNQGHGHFAEPIGLPNANATSVALGDINSDGALDIVLGGDAYDPDTGQPDPTQRSQVYFNDGEGGFHSFIDLPDSGFSYDVALGDVNGDGALDIVSNSYYATAISPTVDLVRLYLNDGQGGFGEPVFVPDTDTSPMGIALGDIDRDGDVDLVSAGGYTYTQIHLNDGQGHFDAITVLPNTGYHDEVALGDLNNDGVLDIALAGYPSQQVFLNRKGDPGNFSSPIDVSIENISVNSLTLGDMNNDGSLDMLYDGEIVFNQLFNNQRLPNNPPTVAITRPGPTPDAALYSTPVILSDQVIPISYSLSDPEGDNVGAVRGFYSLDGGGTWRKAIATTETMTSNLTAAISGTRHLFNWDTFASGVFGRSDNVVFRIEAYPTPLAGARKPPDSYTYRNAVGNMYQRGSVSVTTFPFRMRGTQVQVTRDGMPQPNALVYRLEAGQSVGGSVIGGGTPFTTDAHGFLHGRGELQLGDRLLALVPISTTNSYTMYLTNGAPTEIGVESFTVTQSGVQQLEVSESHPLLLFDVHVSLEWDATASPSYLQQLQFNLQRASQYLYDFSDGQIALGSVTVHQNADDWDTSDVVVHTTNRLRPFAAQGGVVITPTVDPQHADIVYDTGQVHMGAVWNRYGAPGQDLGDDWSLTLAHELSHYLLFQDDAYLGLDADGFLRAVGTCRRSAMGDVYTNPESTEFVSDQAYWNANCAETLGQQTLGRTEWQTLTTWYPQLQMPSAVNAGPSTMPFNVTNISIRPPITPTLALADPTFYLDYANGLVSSNEAHGFLLRDDRYVVDLGSPNGGQNRLLANGAQPGDRICVFDRARQQYGCERVKIGDDRITLQQDTTWAPVIQLTPVTSRTFSLAVDRVPAGLSLKARLFPEYGPGGASIDLIQHNATYSGTVMLADPALAGSIQVWVEEPATEEHPRRETIVTYSIGGNPGHSRGGGGHSRGGGGHSRGGGGHSRGGGGHSRGGGAPLVSSDGQMIFFTPNPEMFQEGQFYTIQGTAGLPLLPSNKSVIGQGYSLVASAGTPVITGSISFQYLSSDVLLAGAAEDQLTIHFWNGSIWQALPTARDTYFNLASTRSQGPGIYVLLAGRTTPTIESINPPSATNDSAQIVTITGSDFLPPAQVVLMRDASRYSLPVTRVTSTTITVVITAGLRADAYDLYVTNGDGGVSPAMRFGVYSPSSARFYDFFESGSDRWQTDGEWGIISLPDGNHAMTDSPANNYKSATLPADRRVTSITSQPFRLDGITNPVLTFRHDYIFARLGSSADIGRVEISADDGVTWTTLASYSGGGIYGTAQLQASVDTEWTEIHWQPVTIDLHEWSGTVRLRFSLDVDQMAADKGWLIDDVLVTTGTTPSTQTHVFLPIIRK